MGFSLKGVMKFVIGFFSPKGVMRFVIGGFSLKGVMKFVKKKKILKLVSIKIKLTITVTKCLKANLTMLKKSAKKK